MERNNRITVEGNGQQAPYGIGEIIATYANTPAGLIKAMRRAAYWYNAATVRLPDGEKETINYDLVRSKDRGYIIN